MGMRISLFALFSLWNRGSNMSKIEPKIRLSVKNVKKENER